MPAPDKEGMRWAADWTGFLQDLGNAEGSDTGEVLVEFVTPVCGMDSVQLSTNDAKAQVNGGDPFSLTLTLKGGRRVFVPWANVAAISDAPAE